MDPGELDDQKHYGGILLQQALRWATVHLPPGWPAAFRGTWGDKKKRIPPAEVKQYFPPFEKLSYEQVRL